MAYIGNRTNQSGTRYEVQDDTLTTWKVVDVEAGVTIEAGLERWRAERLAVQLMEQVQPADGQLSGGSQGEQGSGQEQADGGAEADASTEGTSEA